MAAVSLLAPPPSVGHASTVVEWLGLLDLLLLETKFDNYTLNKISTLWDVQLTSVRRVERRSGRGQVAEHGEGKQGTRINQRVGGGMKD